MKNNLGQHKKIYEKQHITSSAVCFKKIMFPLQQKNVSRNILSKKHTFAKKIHWNLQEHLMQRGQKDKATFKIYTCSIDENKYNTETL